MCVCVYVCVAVYTMSNIRISPEMTCLCRATGETEDGGSRLTHQEKTFAGRSESHLLSRVCLKVSDPREPVA